MLKVTKSLSCRTQDLVVLKPNPGHFLLYLLCSVQSFCYIILDRLLQKERKTNVEEISILLDLSQTKCLMEKIPQI